MINQNSFIFSLLVIIFFQVVGTIFIVINKNKISTVFFHLSVALIPILLMFRDSASLGQDFFWGATEKIICLMMASFFLWISLINIGLPDEDEPFHNLIRSNIFTTMFFVVGAKSFLAFFIVLEILTIFHGLLLANKKDKMINSSRFFLFNLLISFFGLICFIILTYTSNTLKFDNFKVVNDNLFFMSVIFFKIYMFLKIGFIPFYIWKESIDLESNAKSFLSSMILCFLPISFLLMRIYRDLIFLLSPKHFDFSLSVDIFFLFVGVLFLTLNMLVTKAILKKIYILFVTNISLLIPLLYVTKVELKDGHIFIILMVNIVGFIGAHLYFKTTLSLNKEVSLDDWSKKIHETQPIYCIIFLMSMVGFPFTSGFIYKYSLLNAFFASHFKGLTLLTLSLYFINAVVFIHICLIVFKNYKKNECKKFTRRLMFFSLAVLSLLSGYLYQLF